MWYGKGRASYRRKPGHMRLAYSCPDDDYEPFLKVAGDGILNQPFGMNDERQDELRGILRERYRPSDMPDLGESLAYHVQLVGDIVWMAAESCETVSPTFQIGIHTFLMQSAISPIVAPGESFPLRLSPHQPYP